MYICYLCGKYFSPVGQILLVGHQRAFSDPLLAFLPAVIGLKNNYLLSMFFKIFYLFIFLQVRKATLTCFGQFNREASSLRKTV